MSKLKNMFIPIDQKKIDVMNRKTVWKRLKWYVVTIASFLVINTLVPLFYEDLRASMAFHTTFICLILFWMSIGISDAFILPLSDMIEEILARLKRLEEANNGRGKE